jgi:hypothetical protein
MFGWGARPRGSQGDQAERVLPTKVLAKFLAALSHREAPVLLDLGAVVGSNVSFFGERLGCKLFVEDLLAEVERHAKAGKLDQLPAHLETRFPQPDASIDGILCWDVFDYLDRASARVLGRHLARVLTPGGALMGFFATARSDAPPHYTRFAIVDEHTLRHRPYPATRGRVDVLQNRDIALLFPGLRVTESFLLLTRTREILFRKPAAAGSGPQA